MREGLDDVRGSAVASDGAAGDGEVHLAVVGAHPDDPAVLLLRAPDGRTFRLPADARLRAALRGAAPAPAAVPAASGEPLRPRDIQARIRAGETAADVAADAGVPLEQVERYEGPVLAERAHVASLARLAVVRGGPGRLTLEEAVRSRLLARGTDAAAVTWDAWRRDGGWSVQVSFRAAGRDRSAQWTFTPSNRVLEPLDDEARWLTAPADDPTGRRLAPVRVYDVETDDGGAALPPTDLPDLRDLPHRHEPSEPSGLPELSELSEPSVLPDLPGPEPAQRWSAPTDPADPTPADPDGDEPPVDDADDLAARTLDLLDALRDRRGRRVPLDLGPDGEPWDDDEEDDDLLNALLDLPPGSTPAPEELQEEVDRARARLRMVTPPRGLPLGERPEADDDAHAPHDASPEGAGAAPPRASLGLVPAPPPTAPLPASPAPEPAASSSPVPPVSPVSPLRPAPVAGTGPVAPRPAAPSSSSQPPSDDHDDEPGRPADGLEAEHDGDDPSEQPARRRRSVPSWDEIVFGVPRRD